jgi:PAS domain S-box-containing protein
MTSQSKSTVVHEALRASEQQFELLVQSVKEYAIFMLDPQGRITTWNSGAEHIKGYDAEEIIGEHFSRFYPEEDQREGVPMRSLERAATEGRREAEGWRVRKDGTRFRASVVIDAIHDDAGKLIGFAKVTRDITERHLAEEMLEQARERLLQWQKMEAVGQLSGGVAHDFNNLLTIVIGNLETAQRQLGAVSGGVASRLKRALDNAMRGARRAATLTQRLLAFSRQQPLDPKPLDVNKFIAAEVEFLQRSLGETIEVEAVGSAGVWPVEVDAHQLEAALLNLAVNARDAMPDGGKLTIETSNAFLDQDYCSANPEVMPGQYAMIAVSDNGTGMTKHVADRAFEPFFSTKGAGQGTGLGLSQVYGFIKQSSGHIKIYSEVGEGTSVKIYLPRLWEEIDRSDEERQAADAVEGPGHETVLVVEDDRDVRAYLVELLRDLNYRVLSAHDAVSAPYRSAFDRRGATRHERPAAGGTSKKPATKSQGAIHDGLFPKCHRPPRPARSWRCDDPKADHPRRARGTDTRLARRQSHDARLRLVTCRFAREIDRDVASIQPGYALRRHARAEARRRRA